jgi:succinate dehydrogenase / fumarate reductase cytochrome b subunit
MNTSSNSNRPLSPHLQVYRLPMTAIMSISHRITGAILAGGSLLIAAFLVSAVLGEAQYETVRAFASSWFGLVILAGWSFCLYYHLCNGVRHLIWDTASMLSKKQAAVSGWVVILSTILLTGATWCFALCDGSY